MDGLGSDVFPGFQGCSVFSGSMLIFPRGSILLLPNCRSPGISPTKKKVSRVHDLTFFSSPICSVHQQHDRRGGRFGEATWDVAVDVDVENLKKNMWLNCHWMRREG